MKNSRKLILLFFSTFTIIMTKYASLADVAVVPSSKPTIHTLTSAIYDSPIVQSNLIYQIQGTYLRVFDLHTNQLAWQHNLTQHLSLAPYKYSRKSLPINTTKATFYDGMIFIGISSGDQGQVVAVNAITGNLIWKYGSLSTTLQNTTRGAILSQPIIWNNYVIFRTGRGLTAVHLVDGKEIWSVPFDPNGDVPIFPSACPTLSVNEVYFNSDFGIVYAFDPRNGKLLWDRQTAGMDIQRGPGVIKVHITFTFCTPCLYNDNLIATDGKGNMYSFRLDDGAMLWRVSMGYIFQIKIVGTSIYAATNKGFFEINPNTGATLRHFDVPNGILRFAVWNTQAILAYNHKDWVVFDLKSWKVISHYSDFNVNSGLVISNDGILYLSGEDIRSPQSTIAEIKIYRLKDIIKGQYVPFDVIPMNTMHD